MIKSKSRSRHAIIINKPPSAEERVALLVARLKADEYYHSLEIHYYYLLGFLRAQGFQDAHSDGPFTHLTDLYEIAIKKHVN